jgi:hypothetical protein
MASEGVFKMLFHYNGLVPANTQIHAPYWQKLPIRQGKIIQWIVFQPEECADLVKYWVEYHGTQILPFNPDEWMYGFFVPTGIPENIEISDAPFVLDFYAVNEDDSYEHEYHVFVNIEPAEPVKIPATGEAGLWERLSEYLGGD